MMCSVRQARRLTQTKALTNVGGVAQVKPGTLGSTDRAALDNQWATYFLIDPTSGFAPMAWQCAVGPVVLFRPGGAAISIKQVCCMESFLDRLLDTFSDVAPGALLEWMTPLHFGRLAASFNARHNDDGACLRTEAYSRLSLRTEGLISTFTTEDGREITNIEDLEEYVACAYASKRE